MSNLGDSMESRLEDIRKSIYRKYDEDYLKRILIGFYKKQLDVTNFSIENRNISKILNHFFEDLIYRAKSKNGKYSPQDVISSDELLSSALSYIDQHRDFYQQKSDVANLRDFFFSSSMVGKVTNFNPVIARKIFERYVPFHGATIFDYSCGFGSRMLGALSSKFNYNYIGVEPYDELYQRLLIFLSWITRTLSIQSESCLYNLGSEIFIPDLVGKIDLSFSSPPYFNYETYTNSSTQSYIRYPKYYEWLENFVVETVKNIYVYTKKGGLHLVNLEDTKKIRLIDDWIKIALAIGFSLEQVEEIGTRRRTTNKNCNKLLVFKKK